MNRCVLFVSLLLGITSLNACSPAYHNITIDPIPRAEVPRPVKALVKAKGWRVDVTGSSANVSFSSESDVFVEKLQDAVESVLSDSGLILPQTRGGRDTLTIVVDINTAVRVQTPGSVAASIFSGLTFFSLNLLGVPLSYTYMATEGRFQVLDSKENVLFKRSYSTTHKIYNALYYGHHARENPHATTHSRILKQFAKDFEARFVRK